MATESALLRFLTTTTVVIEASPASFALAAGRSSLAIGLACSPGLAGVGSLPPDASGGFDAPHAKANPITKPAATANTVPRVMATPGDGTVMKCLAPPNVIPSSGRGGARATLGCVQVYRPARPPPLRRNGHRSRRHDPTGTSGTARGGSEAAVQGGEREVYRSESTRRRTPADGVVEITGLLASSPKQPWSDHPRATRKVPTARDP